VRVLKAEADEEKAETARLSSFIGAMAVGDLVKSTLGPKGMDKILWGMGRNEGQVSIVYTFLCHLRVVYMNSPNQTIWPFV
jgi:T-complex protein 1 subunit beta